MFQPRYSDSARSLRVLKGVHGFHIYANEFWVDYLTSLIQGEGHLPEHPSLIIAMNELSKKLCFMNGLSGIYDDTSSSQFGIDHLRPFKGLYLGAKAVIQARSSQKLENSAEVESGKLKYVALKVLGSF